MILGGSLLGCRGFKLRVCIKGSQSIRRLYTIPLVLVAQYFGACPWCSKGIELFRESPATHKRLSLIHIYGAFHGTDSKRSGYWR